jgi:hypothetical protein
MSATDDFNMRRTVFATATGAAGTFLMSPGRADDELSKQRGPYRIEDWGKTWINPNKARVLARVPADCHAGHRRILAADHASSPRAAGVCQAHHRSARLHSRLPRRADRARDERGRHVRSLDR